MQEYGYYREQAALARRLAHGTTDATVERQLKDMAQDFEELAGEIEAGVVTVARPDLLTAKQKD